MILKSSTKSGRARLSIEEERKPEATGREMAGIQFVLLAVDKLDQHADSLIARLHDVPNGERRLRTCVTMLGNLLGDLYDTLPQHQLHSIDAMMRHCEVVIRPRHVGKMPGATVVPTESIERLCDLAMRHECGLCVKTDAEVRRCKLRRTLMGLCTLERIPTHGCGYRVFGMDGEGAGQD